MKYPQVFYLIHKHRYISGPYQTHKEAQDDVQRITELLGGLGMVGIKVEVQQTSGYHKPYVMFSP